MTETTDKKIKIIYSEEINLSLKAIFLLKILFKVHNQELRGWTAHDWLHREIKDTYFAPRNEHKSMDIAWRELKDNELVEPVEVCEDCYWKYKLTKKANVIKSKIIRRKTSMYDDLIPENFKY